MLKGEKVISLQTAQTLIGQKVEKGLDLNE